jgi:catechol 2,3-dioxygenase-like lactoylglutathione lyase family enzyme
MDSGPVLSQLNLAVRDMDATIAFYRGLGINVEAEPGAEHVAFTLPSGLTIEWDQADFVRNWDPAGGGATGGTTILGFTLASREAVDDLYATLVADGAGGRQRPFDAFWGARYAIVTDPDGNPVGLMSPVDAEQKYWPPRTPPAT